MKKIYQLSSLAVLSSLISSCSHIVPSHPRNRTQKAAQTPKTPTDYINNFTQETQNNQLNTAIAEEKIPIADDSFLRPIRNKNVEFWINYYTKRSKDRLERFIANGEKYRPIIEDIFTKYGLPKELYYVGIVESGYYNHAKSHASAVGPWQFMKGTAKRYGLKVNSYVDERKNIYKSTQAAALFFQDLYNIFGSWELALAAYNAGEYGIIRRIRGANTREYYELSKRKIIPKETRHYVPKVLAIKEILENTQKYNVKVTKPTHPFFANTKSINIKSSMSLNKLAKITGYKKEILLALNHDIKGRYIPSFGKKGFDLFVPESDTNHQEIINDYLASKPTKTKEHIEVKHNQDNQQHTVRKNESLYSIAKRYNTSAKTLRELNQIKGSTIYVGQKLDLPYSTPSHIVTNYKVKAGDNLSEIARIFKTTLKNLKHMNKMNHSKIYIGQVLTVPKHKVYYYTVSKGDFLGKIADQTDLSITDLKKINNIKSTIFPGQKLILKVELI